MKYYLAGLFALLLLTGNASAQNMRGQLLDSSDRPLRGITIYIKEAKQALVSDANGQFQTLLDDGTYTLKYKHPDYKIIEKVVSTDPSFLSTDTIVLQKKTLFFDESNTKNDTIAYQIIKSVMAKAPFYTEVVPNYKAYSYIKGELKIHDVSAITDLATYKVEKIHLSKYKDMPFRQEIYNEIDYSRPEKYKLTIKGYSGNIPDDFNYKGIINSLGGNIYNRKFNEFISPLNPDGFSYYRYKYEGFYIEDEKVLHKIRVDSKVKDPELLNGYLYIMDDGRYISYSQLTSSTQGMVHTTLVAYDSIEGSVYVPLTYYTNIYFNILGTKGEAEYFASLKYAVSRDSKQSPLAAIYSIDDQASGDIMVESSAYIQDQEYWNRVRSNPLQLSVSESDTIRFEKRKYHPGNFWFGKIVLGGYIHGNDTTSWSLRYSGVKEIFKDYNYVDGFWLGEKFEIKTKLSGNRSIDITPHIYYVTARHRAIGWSDAVFNYAPDKRGLLTLSLGSKSEDFNSLTVTRYQNYFMSLFFGDNYNFLYQKDYVTLGHSINMNKRLRLGTTLGVARRHGLSNNTDFTVFRKSHIKPNIYPDGRFDKTFYGLSISYSPFFDFPLTDGIKTYDRRRFPIFHLEYEEGFSSWQTNNSKYRKIKGGIMHNIRINYFNRLDYKIEAGSFIGGAKDKIHFADYQHFGASDLLINLNSLYDSFLLADNYELQTNRYWVNLSLNYSGRYVLFKRLSFFQGNSFSENLHFRTLYIPDIELYTELGYSVGLTRSIGIGAFVAFHNEKYKSFGVRFSLNLSSLNF